MAFNICKRMIFVIIILFSIFVYTASSQTAGDWVEKGNALIKSEEYEKALEAFNKAIVNDPKEKSAWLYKGNVLSLLNEHRRAIEAYDRALAIDPNYKEAWLFKSGTLFELGEYEKGFEAIDKAIAIDPNYEIAWNAKGLAHWDFKEYEKAVEAFDRALTINPNSEGSWALKGDVLNDWGKYEKAIEAFDKAIFLDPNDKYAWYSKGFALYKLGRYKDSIEAFDRAFEIDPSLKEEDKFRELAIMKMTEQKTSTPAEGLENNWIIISGIAIFIIIGIIALRNRKKGLSLSSSVEKQERGKLWSQFKGMANTDEILIEKSKAFAPLLFNLISDDTKSLFEDLKKDKERKIDDEKFGGVFLEMVLFNLHYLDRIAFQHLGAEKRNVFMDTLIIEFSKALERVDVSDIDVAQFRSSFVETYDERGHEYEKYKKSFPEKNESPKDTLFWEFEKKIALILGSEKDIFVMMRVGNVTFTKYMYLELPELFSGENK